MFMQKKKLLIIIILGKIGSLVKTKVSQLFFKKLKIFKYTLDLLKFSWCRIKNYRIIFI